MSASPALALGGPTRPKPKVTWRDDARQRQTQAALEHTILAFSAERPSTALTVTEITDNAGINRSTFYAHTPNATEFLRAVMQNRLAQTTPTTATRDVFIPELVAQLIDHIRRYQSVYVTAQQDLAANASLRDGLTDFTCDRLTLPPLELPPEISALIAAATTQAIYPAACTSEDCTVDEAIARVREGGRVITELLELKQQTA